MRRRRVYVVKGRLRIPFEGYRTHTGRADMAARVAQAEGAAIEFDPQDRVVPVSVLVPRRPRSDSECIPRGRLRGPLALAVAIDDHRVSDRRKG